MYWDGEKSLLSKIDQLLGYTSWRDTKISILVFRVPVRPKTGSRRHRPVQFIFKQGETDMGDKGKKDKGKREQQKKAQLSQKEKRKSKKEKKK